MMLKIDTYAIAQAVADGKEKQFPRRAFEELGWKVTNTNALVRRYQYNNTCMTVPFDSGHITSKTNVYACKYRERKFLMPKTQRVGIGQINLVLKDQPNSLIFFNNSKALILCVRNEDIMKFDVLLGTSEGVVDLAQFIRENDIFVDNFELIL